VGVTDGEGLEEGVCEGDVGTGECVGGGTLGGRVGGICVGAIGGGGIQVENVHGLESEPLKIHSLPQTTGLSVRSLKNKIKKKKKKVTFLPEGTRSGRSNRWTCQSIFTKIQNNQRVKERRWNLSTQFVIFHKQPL